MSAGSFPYASTGTASSPNAGGGGLFGDSAFALTWYDTDQGDVIDFQSGDVKVRYSELDRPYPFAPQTFYSQVTVLLLVVLGVVALTSIFLRR